MYGRVGGSTRSVCTGERNTGPGQDCFVVDAEILEQVAGACQGRSSCSLPVGGYLTDLSSGCNTNMKELNVTYSCGTINKYGPDVNISSVVQCYPWQSYVLTDDCVYTALLLNKWTDSLDLELMTEEDMKELLKEKLSKSLDPGKHSLSDLSFRSVTGDQSESSSDSDQSTTAR